MTVSYSLDAASASSTTFIRLILRWKGSVWKLVLIEVAVWFLLAIATHSAYFFFIRNTELESDYRRFVRYVNELPFKSAVTILLSLTTVTCLARWQDIYRLLVWPDNAALLFNAFYNEKAVSPWEAQRMRATVARYLMLAYILLLRDVSQKIRKRFPTFEMLASGGLLTKDEMRMMKLACLKENMCTYWIPLLWLLQLVKKRYKYKKNNCVDSNGSIMNEYQCDAFVGEIIRIRGMLGDILAYDWIPIPLALTQIITLCVYALLVLSVFVIQTPYMESKRYGILEVPFLLLWHLLFNSFYLGWLKCSQVVLNPFGDDDDDFEVNWLLDRHWQVLSSLLLHPEKNIQPPSNLINTHEELPHTVGSAFIS